MFEKIARPSSTAATMVAKLSSASTMSAASLDTSVPVMPMAMPMSAVFRAGASLTPSPVMATVRAPRCHALPRHGGRQALALQCSHDPQLVLGIDARVHRHVADGLIERLLR